MGKILYIFCSLLFFYLPLLAQIQTNSATPPAFIDSILPSLEENDIRHAYQQALAKYAANDLEEAEKQALHVNERMADYREADYQQLLVDNYLLLSQIYEAKGAFQTAIFYEDLKSAHELAIHNNEMKAVELKQIADKKEAEVANLKTTHAFHRKTAPFITAICILLSVATILLFLLFHMKKKNLEAHTLLEKKAKDDVLLKLKLEEEQAKKTTLEKFGVLSDFYLKEMELIGKNKELELLETEKKALDKQVELFAKKIAAYEWAEETKPLFHKDHSEYTLFKKDIEQLICKYAYDTKGYMDQLNLLNNVYIDKLQEKHEGVISAQYIKYCICFAIGMEIPEVATCFSIEQGSVHGLRYRLKKKFGLGPDENLELFLKALLINTA